MGFWHTGYIEFHEPTGLGLSGPRQPPVFVCDRCGESFSSAAARDDHRFEAHPQHKPVLIVQGRELGAHRLRITQALVPSDVRLDCDRAWLNDGEIPACELGDALADCDTPDVCRIKLRKDGIDTGFELEFRIASDKDLTYVESRFEKIICRGRLDLRVVDDFHWHKVGVRNGNQLLRRYLRLPVRDPREGTEILIRRWRTTTTNVNSTTPLRL